MLYICYIYCSGINLMRTSLQDSVTIKLSHNCPVQSHHYIAYINPYSPINILLYPITIGDATLHVWKLALYCHVTLHQQLRRCVRYANKSIRILYSFDCF